MDGVFELGEGGVFDVQIGLRPMPVELEEMVVEAESGPMSFLERNGFYDRVIGRGGVFMIREDIDRLAVDKVTDVFRQIPLLDTDESRPLTGGPDVFRNPEIRVIRNGQYCSPTLYIDRHMVDSGSLGGGSAGRLHYRNGNRCHRGLYTFQSDPSRIRRSQQMRRDPDLDAHAMRSC